MAESDPALEWQETMHKASRLLAAVGGSLREREGPGQDRASARSAALLSRT